jgi:hypothetical protein
MPRAWRGTAKSYASSDDPAGRLPAGWQGCQAVLEVQRSQWQYWAVLGSTVLCCAVLLENEGVDRPSWSWLVGCGRLRRAKREGSPGAFSRRTTEGLVQQIGYLVQQRAAEGSTSASTPTSTPPAAGASWVSKQTTSPPLHQGCALGSTGTSAADRWGRGRSTRRVGRCGRVLLSVRGRW